MRVGFPAFTVATFPANQGIASVERLLTNEYGNFVYALMAQAAASEVAAQT
jgi:hypothetical protein